MKQKFLSEASIQKSILNESTMSTQRLDANSSIEKLFGRNFLDHNNSSMFRPEGSQINIEDALTQYEYVQTACNHIHLVEKNIEKAKFMLKEYKKQIADLKQAMNVMEHQQQKEIGQVMYEFKKKQLFRENFNLLQQQFAYEYEVQMGENLILSQQLKQLMAEVDELQLGVDQSTRDLQNLEPQVGQYQMFRLQPE